MLPHGNFPNQSESNFRMVQYVKFIPVDDPREFEPAVACCKFDRDDWFPHDFELSPLGKCMYGLKDWSELNVENELALDSEMKVNSEYGWILNYQYR